MQTPARTGLAASGHPCGTQDPDTSRWTCRKPRATTTAQPGWCASLDANATIQHAQQKASTGRGPVHTPKAIPAALRPLHAAFMHKRVCRVIQYRKNGYKALLSCAISKSVEQVCWCPGRCRRRRVATGRSTWRGGDDGIDAPAGRRCHQREERFARSAGRLSRAKTYDMQKHMTLFPVNLPTRNREVGEVGL